MFSFIFSHIFSLKIRSISIILITILFTVLLTIFVLLYKNTLSAIDYYGPTNIDPRRVIFLSQTNLFDMFAKNGGGIAPDLVKKIESDPLFFRTRSLSFVDTNVIGGFDIFSFHLDTDVPVFSLRDSVGDIQWFGISPSMIHYYNIELAGSHPMFPKLDDSFLQWKKVSLTFGASKIFQVWSAPSTPLIWTITSIDSDYPGFGIVASEIFVWKKLSEISIHPRLPYKIIAYMKDPAARNEVEKKYNSLSPKFDSDTIIKREKQLSAWIAIFGWVGIIFIGSIAILLVLLFLWYFREKEPLFRLAHIYGLTFPSKQILLYSEALLLLSISIIVAYGAISFIQKITFAFLKVFLGDHGILFPLIEIDSLSLGIILLGSFAFLISIIFFTSLRK